jgi:hypothetical protein
MLARLGVVQTLTQTVNPVKGVANLVDALADGAPAIVWPEMWSLPYNALSPDAGMWGAFPVVVYGHDADRDVVSIADRARVPLILTTGELAAARGRIKKDKHRVVTLDLPGHDKLASAVHLGICDCIKLFTETPPKGAKHNFGLAALRFWARMLTEPNQRLSWRKVFPPGLPMYAGLKSAYEFAFLFGKNTEQDAERGVYAAFLDEAALILKTPALYECAELFRASAQTWRGLPGALLPDAAPLLGETRALMLRRHTIFLEQGAAAVPEMRAIDARLTELRKAARVDFPLSANETADLCTTIAHHLHHIHEAEAAAVAALQAALGVMR